MAGLAEVVELAHDAARARRWSQTYRLLRDVDPTELTPDDLMLFADAAWWCCRVPEEIALRRRAFREFSASNRPRQAASAAWELALRHSLRGQTVESSGWLRMAQRALEDQPDCVEKGYVACSESEAALGGGEMLQAQAHAERALAVGERFDESGLVALALTWKGLCSLLRHEMDEGLKLLDEAMATITSREMDEKVAGWVACFAVGLCMDAADVRRAAAWSQAAWEWASALPEATPFHGICRVHQVEVMHLQGRLEDAAAQARRACDEMLAFDPHLAGEAFYVTGEILRRQGDLPGAEQAFRRARELGHDAQPGLALIRQAEGRTHAAMAALRAASTDASGLPFRRASVLAALVHVALAADAVDCAGDACRDLDAVAVSSASEAVSALAGTTRARLRLVGGDAEGALAALRPAADIWRSLDLHGELAEARLLTGLALRQLGDDEGAALELAAAHRAFVDLGATADADRVAAQMADEDARPGGLSARECEVLRLVAAGHTNRQIAAELVLSEHTVARHLSNIYTKLRVPSRTKAAAFAFQHDLA